ncbi:hypothetical protein [Haloferula sp. A504]|uniref:hypothetical protein n=1 Tax=Haloferula sp. A504 TaxID=3373601 RepID=UPI0031BE9DB7|nr:hypothetical protein [Verrucomicrobiaceae bacterium E54]
MNPVLAILRRPLCAALGMLLTGAAESASQPEPPVEIIEIGTWNIEIFLDSPSSGVELILRVGTIYQIQTSTDLGIVDPRTAVVPDINDLDRIQDELPPGGSRRFARLAVTP